VSGVPDRIGRHHSQGSRIVNAVTNIFVEDGDGGLLTPPARLGLLPGVYRRTLIEQGRVREADLRIEDLDKGFFLGNALRLLMKATLKT